ncbi:glycine zipper domain-containing protein, partial [Burkholderia cepacia]|uniref:glycine zipper domain-containing protein n=1 Tax=Burkholderia cepacia TaxID=292 RepID=UPI001F0E3524
MSAHAGDCHGKPDLTLHYDRFTGKVLNSRIDISKSGEGRQMLKKWAGMAAIVGAMVAVSAPAVAGDTNNALGGALGGVAGAAVGNAVGGSTGAIIGGAVGGGAGGAVTSNKRERTGA